ncbi:hypothetical protein AB0B45_28865 [Nonomuraea sp. NPDC049152]|uniref:hypothetical protein n=1 Tax=Nonomuraea sp. NPDC049152 TaxID=3154350 RepID=UPI0033F77434
MGSDGGVDVSRQAVRNARNELDEIFDLFVPGATSYDAEAVAFPENGPVRGLASNYEAFGGIWTAALGMRSSFTNAEAAVAGTYTSISRTLGASIVLLGAALAKFDEGEQKSTEHANTAEV